jgi:hypothetical protein
VLSQADYGALQGVGSQCDAFGERGAALTSIGDCVIEGDLRDPGQVVILAFEYMRLSVSVRGCVATGPGSERFADVHSFDAMLTALGADGRELVTGQAAESGAHTYLSNRQIG